MERLWKFFFCFLFYKYSIVWFYYFDLSKYFWNRKKNKHKRHVWLLQVDHHSLILCLILVPHLPHSTQANLVHKEKLQKKKNESETITAQCTQEGTNNNYQDKRRSSATQGLKLVIMLKGVLSNYVFQKTATGSSHVKKIDHLH